MHPRYGCFVVLLVVCEFCSFAVVSIFSVELKLPFLFHRVINKLIPGSFRFGNMAQKCQLMFKCATFSSHNSVLFLLLFSSVNIFNNVDLFLVPPSSNLFSNNDQKVECVSVHFSKNTPCVWEELS